MNMHSRVDKQDCSDTPYSVLDADLVDGDSLKMGVA